MAYSIITLECTFTVTATMECYVETQGEPLMERQDPEEIMAEVHARGPVFDLDEGSIEVTKPSRSWQDDLRDAIEDNPMEPIERLPEYGGRFGEEPPHGQAKPGEDHR